MRALFVCPFVPWPLDSGGRIRTFQLARALAARGDVELALWCVADERDPAPLTAALSERVDGEVRLFPRTRVGAVERWTRAKYERWFASDALRDALARRGASDPPDLVHVDEMSALRSVPDLPGALVVHHHKLDLEFHARTYGDGPAARFDRDKVRRLEREAARRTRHHVTCSAGDRAALLARHPNLEIAAVPSGFDPATFAPDTWQGGARIEREAARLLVLGSLDYEPNVDGLEWLVHEVLEHVRSRATVRVVGRGPTARVRAVCDVSKRVELVGAVDDVREELARAAALLVPLRIGGGTRLKIVEALAMCTPVLSTSIGAEGLMSIDEHVVRADGARAFAAAIDTLLAAPDEALRRAERGRAAVRAHLTWDALAARLFAAWRGAVAG